MHMGKRMLEADFVMKVSGCDLLLAFDDQGPAEVEYDIAIHRWVTKRDEAARRLVFEHQRLAQAKEGLVRLASKYFDKPGRVYHAVRLMGAEAGDYMHFSHVESMRERAIARLMFQRHAEEYYIANQRMRRRREREITELANNLIAIIERAGISTRARLKLLQDSVL